MQYENPGAVMRYRTLPRPPDGSAAPTCEWSGCRKAARVWTVGYLPPDQMDGSGTEHVGANSACGRGWRPVLVRGCCAHVNQAGKAHRALALCRCGWVTEDGKDTCRSCRERNRRVKAEQRARAREHPNADFKHTSVQRYVDRVHERGSHALPPWFLRRCERIEAGEPRPSGPDAAWPMMALYAGDASPVPLKPKLVDREPSFIELEISKLLDQLERQRLWSEAMERRGAEKDPELRDIHVLSEAFDLPLVRDDPQVAPLWDVLDAEVARSRADQERINAALREERRPPQIEERPEASVWAPRIFQQTRLLEQELDRLGAPPVAEHAGNASACAKSRNPGSRVRTGDPSTTGARARVRTSDLAAGDDGGPPPDWAETEALLERIVSELEECRRRAAELALPPPAPERPGAVIVGEFEAGEPATSEEELRHARNAATSAGRRALKQEIADTKPQINADRFAGLPPPGDATPRRGRRVRAERMDADAVPRQSVIVRSPSAKPLEKWSAEDLEAGIAQLDRHLDDDWRTTDPEHPLGLERDRRQRELDSRADPRRASGGSGAVEQAAPKGPGEIEAESQGIAEEAASRTPAAASRRPRRRPEDKPLEEWSVEELEDGIARWDWQLDDDWRSKDPDNPFGAIRDRMQRLLDAMPEHGAATRTCDSCHRPLKASAPADQRRCVDCQADLDFETAKKAADHQKAQTQASWQHQLAGERRRYADHPVDDSYRAPSADAWMKH